jgi:activator of HSP90 ATPase
MEKIGLVRDLGKDGLNINKHHWEERNCFKWGETELKKIYENKCILKNEKIEIITKNIIKYDGELFINIRKKYNLF